MDTGMRLRRCHASILLLIILIPVLQLHAQKAVMVSPKLIDFGRVRRGVIANDSLGIANTGNEPVKLKTVSSTCGCTVLRFKQRTLEPGDTAFIPFTFNTRGYTGLIRKKITVYFEKNRPEPIRFDLQADIYTDIAIEPRYIYLKELSQNSTEPIVNTFKIVNNLQRSLKVDKISCDNSMIAIYPDAFTVVPGKSRPFRINVLPREPGRHHIQVILKSDYEDRPRTIIPIYLQINE